ncbi:U3-containing 90S pre-ribosomal complex subunit-domain containing protein [Limtongia smithiae]|uniref:U3-containing 90S pre-ribosomal complex subunit-domain containing protein n=1 Tax=Limtongia smithiae TaxID=1125753 RepID=UPI0034CEC0D5
MKRKSQNIPDADDLDDGLEYDLEDDNGPAADGILIDGRLAVSSASEEEYATVVPETVKIEDSNAKSNKAEKRKRVRERSAAKKRSRIETEKIVKTTIASSTPSIIADYIASKARLWHPKLTPIELDEQFSAREKSILDTSNWNVNRSTLNEFEKFLKQCVAPSKLEAVPNKKGAPYIVILAISALRACEVRRAIPKKIKTMKMIAKNSVEADCKFLKNSSVAIVASTPARLRMMVNRNALSLANLETIVIDGTFLDAKMRTVLDDVPETLRVMKELITLGSTAEKDVKIALF